MRLISHFIDGQSVPRTGAITNPVYDPGTGQVQALLEHCDSAAPAKVTEFVRLPWIGERSGNHRREALRQELMLAVISAMLCTFLQGLHSGQTSLPEPDDPGQCGQRRCDSVGGRKQEEPAA